MFIIDPYKPEGILRMDIDHFSDFARGSSETHQKLSEPIFVRGLPWRILAMPREQNRVRFYPFSIKFEYFWHHFFINLRKE